MSKQRRFVGFVAAGLLAAVVSTAMMHWSPNGRSNALAGMDQLDDLPTGASSTSDDVLGTPAGAAGGAKKTGRYEAVIANWKRHRSEKQAAR